MSINKTLTIIIFIKGASPLDRREKKSMCNLSQKQCKNEKINKKGPNNFSFSFQALQSATRVHDNYNTI